MAVERRIIVPLIVACALFMQNLDSTALATALPAISGSLGETPLRLHLAITVFMLSLAAFLPMSGWVADRFGARKIFTLAMVIFTGASIACGLVNSLDWLLVARAVQGIGGAMMVPVGRLIVIRSVPKSELIAAMALMGMPALIGPIIAPVVAGLILTVTTWRWIFWLNVPIGILGIVLALIFIDDVREDDVSPFDWTGFVLSSVGLCGTLFGLDALTTHHEIDPVYVGALVAGLICATLYVFHARRAKDPILDLALMRFQTFRVSVGGGTFFRIGVGAMPFLLPLTMQQGFGYTPLQSGTITFFSAVGSLTMRSAAQRVLRRFGFRSVLVWNTLFTCVFTALCALFTPTTPYLIMVAIIFAGGVFRSLNFTAITTLGYADIDHRMMSQATSFSQMSQRLALTGGVAISAFVLHVASRGAATIPVEAFQMAFISIAIISALSVFSFTGLSPDAGAEIAGRKQIRSKRFDR